MVKNGFKECREVCKEESLQQNISKYSNSILLEVENKEFKLM